MASQVSTCFASGGPAFVPRACILREQRVAQVEADDQRAAGLQKISPANHTGTSRHRDATPAAWPSMIRGYVPQRHRCPFIAVRICASVGRGVFESSSDALDDHAVVAVAALHRLFVDHGLLHRMQRGRLWPASFAPRTRPAALRASSPICPRPRIPESRTIGFRRRSPAPNTIRTAPGRSRIAGPEAAARSSTRIAAAYLARH